MCVTVCVVHGLSDSPTLLGGGREAGGSAAEEAGVVAAAECAVDAAMRSWMNCSWSAENNGGSGSTYPGGCAGGFHSW